VKVKVVPHKLPQELQGEGLCVDLSVQTQSLAFGELCEVGEPNREVNKPVGDILYFFKELVKRHRQCLVAS
jgi:hypothetical protein